MTISPLIPIDYINLDRIKPFDISLRMARADKMHELASGNKIYKLKPILEYAKAHNFKQILSFGGAYSNHIHALALLAEQHGIESIALIRGEAEYIQNPTLSDARYAGMSFEFVSRAEYKQRNEPKYLSELQKRYPQALIIAEGGSSPLAIQGCAQMARDINQSTQHSCGILAIAAGTGATAAGLACGLENKQQLNVYSVLKDQSLESRIDDFIHAEQVSPKHPPYSLHQADFGGYAKLDIELLDFILQFLKQTNILLDPIYTSKMCLRVIQQIESNEFLPGTSITLIHSGGLQGWRGMQLKVESLMGGEAWNLIRDYLKV